MIFFPPKQQQKQESAFNMHPQARETKQEEPNGIFLPPKQQQKERKHSNFRV
jgi:hypothetical protein